MNINMLSKVITTLIKASESKKYMLSARIVGHTGVGKTEVMHQIADECDMKFVVIPAGMIADPGDLLGLMQVIIDEENNEFTKYIPPSYLPRSGKVFFLIDEINHANPMVRNALFEFLLKGTLGSYQAPKNSYIATCENPDTDDYSSVVSYFNKAAGSRSCILRLDPDLDVFTHHAIKNSNIFDMSLVQFFNEKKEYLIYYKENGLEDFDLDSQVCPNFRTIELVSQVIKLEPPKDVLTEILCGYLGRVAAYDFIENASIKFTYEDIINNFSQYKKTVKEAVENNAIASVHMVLEKFVQVIKEGGDLNKEQSKNFLGFLLNIDLEMAHSVLIKLVVADFKIENGVRKDFFHLSNPDGSPKNVKTMIFDDKNIYEKLENAHKAFESNTKLDAKEKRKKVKIEKKE